jgi:hypothetical protein
MVNKPLPPPARRLRTFAFDPSLATQLDTADLNVATLAVAWEDGLQPGPVGEYFEVVDYDPASDGAYEPVDLNDPYLLAQDGLAPSEGNPQFHQQMVYAVAMTTIRHFELALGRRALWTPRAAGDQTSDGQYVQRLRLYPHALREANAYYSPDKKAILFGYFPASLTDPGKNLPGGMVFTCLSHDIIAHETTHALLDGLHPRFIQPTNPDTLALHEGFADIVAILQHFSQPEMLRQQIARTGGDLARQNLLGQLARQFGEATGKRGALRDAIGRVNEATGAWEPHQPDPAEFRKTLEPHARGAIFVGAVFDAFLSIYKSRIVDLLRIASNGTGILPQGELHPDLVNRMAQEAAKSARHVLQMCIRALDYLPPVDVTIGDYLRAVVTADTDMVPDDGRGYRIAMIEAFRQRGIFPHDVRSLSVDSLRWQEPRTAFPNLREQIGDFEWRVWNLDSDRGEIYRSMKENRKQIEDWLNVQPIPTPLAHEMGVMVEPDEWHSVQRANGCRRPRIEVHSVRPSHRVGPDGETRTDLVVELTQVRAGFFDANKQTEADKGAAMQGCDFDFRGGCTLLLNADNGDLRYCISKDIVSPTRLERTRRFLSGEDVQSLRATYFGNPAEQREPFAFVHREH